MFLSVLFFVCCTCLCSLLSYVLLLWFGFPVLLFCVLLFFVIRIMCLCLYVLSFVVVVRVVFACCVIVELWLFVLFFIC